MPAATHEPLSYRNYAVSPTNPTARGCLHSSGAIAAEPEVVAVEQESELNPEGDKRRDGDRPEGEPKEKTSGQGAASALATWREIERGRLDPNTPEEAPPQ